MIERFRRRINTMQSLTYVKEELKNNWVSWGLFIVVLLLFAVSIYDYRDIFLSPRDIENSVVNQNKSNETIGEITGDMEISQTFIAEKDNFSRIQIPFGTFNRENVGTLDIKLLNDREEVLFSSTVNVQDLSDGTFTNINIPPLKDTKGKDYTLIIKSNGLEKGRSVTLWKSSEDVYSAGELLIDGDKQSGDLRFKVVDVQKKPLVKKQLFSTLSIFFLLLFTASLFAIRKVKNQLHKVFLIIIFPIGLLLAIMIPPFDQLDELEHYYRAFEVSEGNIINQMTVDGYGNYIPVSLVDTVSNVRYIHQDGYKYGLVKDAFGVRLNPENRVLLRNYASSYPPIIYLPQSLGILIGKAFDSPLLMMFLGRIINLLAYISIMYFAIKIAPIKKFVFFLLALLPISVVHATSLSADAITNSTALLFVSYILYLAYGKVAEVNWKHIMVVISIGLFIALSKLVYIPMILLFLIIPFKKFKDKKDYINKIILVLIGCTIPFIIWNLLNISNLSVPDLRINQNVSPKDQVMFVLTHPLYYMKVVLDTMYSLGPTQLITMVGKAATNYVYQAPSIVIYTYIFMLLFFGIVNDKNDLLVEHRKIDKGIFLLIFISVFVLIYTALYVGITNIGDPIIGGIQGRYFIPIAVFLILSLSNRQIVTNDKKLEFLVSTIIHSAIYLLLLQYIFQINQ
ncbi:DUF2142 domain-containing protein [Bacillus yapensis]|uniref:DUF2142 domain-containing protein n=1 Tax=Bacillus yapensis TaxID=2492960 RepID=UPI001484F1B2|nr:DUF2142 domain-containing protein [Bacillus yapensis]